MDQSHSSTLPSSTLALALILKIRLLPFLASSCAVVTSRRLRSSCLPPFISVNSIAISIWHRGAFRITHLTRRAPFHSPMFGQSALCVTFGELTLPIGCTPHKLKISHGKEASNVIFSQIEQLLELHIEIIFRTRFTIFVVLCCCLIFLSRSPLESSAFLYHSITLVSLLLLLQVHQHRPKHQGFLRGRLEHYLSSRPQSKTATASRRSPKPHYSRSTAKPARRDWFETQSQYQATSLPISWSTCLLQIIVSAIVFLPSASLCVHRSHHCHPNLPTPTTSLFLYATPVDPHRQRRRMGPRSVSISLIVRALRAAPGPYLLRPRPLVQ